MAHFFSYSPVNASLRDTASPNSEQIVGVVITQSMLLAVPFSHLVLVTNPISPCYRHPSLEIKVHTHTRRRRRRPRVGPEPRPSVPNGRGASRNYLGTWVLGFRQTRRFLFSTCFSGSCGSFLASVDYWFLPCCGPPLVCNGSTQVLVLCRDDGESKGHTTNGT